MARAEVVRGGRSRREHELHERRVGREVTVSLPAGSTGVNVYGCPNWHMPPRFIGFFPVCAAPAAPYFWLGVEAEGL